MTGILARRLRVDKQQHGGRALYRLAGYLFNGHAIATSFSGLSPPGDGCARLPALESRQEMPTCGQKRA